MKEYLRLFDEYFETYIVMFILIYFFISRNFYLNIFLPLLVLWFIIKVYNKGMKTSFYEKYMPIFVTSILISLIFSGNAIEFGLKKLFSDLNWILLPTILGQIDLNEKKEKYFILSIPIAIAIFLYDYLKELYNLTKFTDIFVTLSKLGVRYRAIGDYSFPSYSSVMLVVSFLVLIFCLKKIFLEKKYIILIVCIFELILLSIFLIFTQSRGMYLTIIILVSINLFFKFKEKALLLCLPLLFGIYNLIYKINNIYTRRAQKIFELDSSNIGRLEVWKESLNLFKKNIVFGIGYENFFALQNTSQYKIHEIYGHQHNLILKLLSETGLFGLFSYILLIVNILINLYKNIEQNFCKIAFNTVLILLIYENFELIINRRKVYEYIFIVLAFGLNYSYRRRSE
ncbi:MAG: O-antigen ligase family protein [Cetobacterium sp.]